MEDRGRSISYPTQAAFRCERMRLRVSERYSCVRQCALWRGYLSDEFCPGHAQTTVGKGRLGPCSSWAYFQSKQSSPSSSASTPHSSLHARSQAANKAIGIAELIGFAHAKMSTLFAVVVSMVPGSYAINKFTISSEISSRWRFPCFPFSRIFPA